MHNISVEINVFWILAFVTVEMIALVFKTLLIIIAVTNQIPAVKAIWETLNVKDRLNHGTICAMALADKIPDLDTPCYPAKTKQDVMNKFLHVEENLSA